MMIPLYCVCSYVSFEIFVSYKEQFCNGSEMVIGSLTDGIYFQYRTIVNRTWITVDYYNGMIYGVNVMQSCLHYMQLQAVNM